MRRLTSVLLCLLILLYIPGCSKGNMMETEPSAAPESSGEEIVQEDNWVSKLDAEKICVQFQPTAETTLANKNLYYIPSDQDGWLRVYTAAVEKADYEKHWISGDSGCGIFICYQDEMWQLLGSGELQEAEFGRVSAEDAQELYKMCLDAAESYGIPAPVRPEQIQNLMSATLEYQGTYTVTDRDKLDSLQRWLSDASEMRGGTNCPLEAMLSLTLESGEELKLRIATDSCCVWMSEGVYYQYGHTDNRELLSFFTGE